MLKSNQELYNECDMLEGNINRMCVTDNFKELSDMRYFALLRIMKIYDFNFRRLELLEKNKDNQRFQDMRFIKGVFQVLYYITGIFSRLLNILSRLG